MHMKNFLSQIQIKSAKRFGSKHKSVSSYIKNRIKTIREYALSDYTVPVIGYGDLNIDVCEKGNKIEVKVEIPGVSAENIKITSQENKLIINVEKKFEIEEKNKNYYIMECTYGNFMRSIPLPFKINNDKVVASLENGVLNVIVPKPTDLENREQIIEIKKKK